MKRRFAAEDKPDTSIECARCHGKVTPWQTTAYQYGLCDTCLCGDFA